MKTYHIIVGLVILGFVGICSYLVLPQFFSHKSDLAKGETQVAAAEAGTETVPSVPIPPPVTHIAPPTEIKSLYLTGWAAGTSSLRDHVVKLLDTTEANAVVIDIKDYSGKISYEVADADLVKIGASEKRIADIAGLIKTLHEKNIYVIGRVAVFQDPYFVKLHPEYAVKKNSDKTVPWGDRKGIHWLDAGAQPVWDYVIAIAKDAYTNEGFDEINFDYIRFPSDGDMKNIYFPYSEGKSKADTIKSFFEYLHANLKDSGMKTSADLFGMTTTNTDDLGIGQVLENALPNFDYVDPMVYPSHYPATWNGFKNPADHPYDVVKIAMQSAVDKANAIGVDPLKLRPWIQDFNLGATYTAAMVRAQMTATTDVGLKSWLIWDPSNKFISAEEALKKE